MFCKYCGNKLDDDALFCTKCGKKLEKIEAKAKDNNKAEDVKQVEFEKDKLEEKNTKEVKEEAKNTEEIKEENKKEDKSVKKKSKAPIFIIIFILFAIIVSLLIAIIIIPKIQADNEYNEQLEISKNYLDNGKNDRAVSGYKKAISMYPEKLDAYIALADAYVQIGDYKSAIASLTDVDANLNEGDRAKLEEKLADIKNYYESNFCNLIINAYDMVHSTDDDMIAASEVTIKLIKGFNNDESNDSYMIIETNDGEADFENVEKGEYTLVIEGNEYITFAKNVTLEEDEIIDEYLLENPESGDAVIVARWEGERDVDLCFFNAASKQRISIGNPTDKDGSKIYKDNKSLGYEVLYIHDVYADKVRSIYLVDNDSINGNQNGKTMEEEGINISVYYGEECKYTRNAEENKTESIWYPFYIYGGEIYDDVDSYYDADEAGFEWAKLTKEGAEDEMGVFDPENEAIKAFTDFINGESTVRVGNDTKDIYELIYEGEHLEYGWGPYRLGYRYIYIENADYPALALEMVYNDGVHKDSELDMSQSGIVAYEGGKLVFKRGITEGMADEGWTISYKNYLASASGYDPLGDDYSESYRMNEKYEYVEDTPFLICFDEIYDDYYGVENMTESELEDFWKENYSGWIVYESGSGMTVEKHFESLDPVDIQYTERIMLN